MAIWLRAASAGDTEPGRWARWLAPPVIPRRWCAAAFVICAAFGTGVALFSHNGLHRRWGLVAALAYLVAAAAVLAWRSRGIDLALLVSLGGALVTPLFWNAATGRRQPEVGVIQRSASELVHYHSPYQSVATLASVHNPNAYNPYLPVMSLFGIPRALFGPSAVTDPRVWFSLAFLVIFGLALAATGARQVVRWTLFVTATPVIAFELAVGGTDVPILALICLGLALLWRRPRHVLAGLAIGVAAAAKATAWPAVVVAAVLIGIRDGRRQVLYFLGAAVAACDQIRVFHLPGRAAGVAAGLAAGRAPRAVRCHRAGCRWSGRPVPGGCGRCRAPDGGEWPATGGGHSRPGLAVSLGRRSGNRRAVRPGERRAVAAAPRVTGDAVEALREAADRGLRRRRRW